MTDYEAGYLAGLKAAEDALFELEGYTPWGEPTSLVDRDELADEIDALRGQNTEGGA